MLHSVRILAWLASTALLAACAVTPEQRAAVEPQAIAFAPKQGVVMVKVASNRNIGTFFGKWQTLRVKRLETDETYDLADRSPAGALHSFYVGSVPVGTYQLMKFDSQAHGAISIYSSAALGPQTGRFAVAEGKVTDLGTILYLRPYYPLNTTAYRLAFGQVARESEQALRSLSPAVAEAARQGALGWQPPTASEQRTALDKGAESPSLFLNSPRRAADGSLLFGEALGLVSRRDAAGKWTWMDTGTLNTILALHVTRDGTIVAGSEQSLLLAKPAASEGWRQIPFPLVDASIRFIGEHARLGYVVVAQDRRSIVALTCDDLREPKWTELKRIPVELFANPMMDTRFEAFLATDRLVIVTTSPQFTLKIAFHVLDLGTRAWSEVPVDLYGLAYSAMDDGAIYAMAGPNISQNLYVSRDSGKSWEKRNSPNWMYQPVFRNAGEGFAVRIESIPVFDPEKQTNSLWRTTDGGLTWSKVSDLPNLSSKLVLDEPAGHMLLVTANGKLFRTKDGGVTWEQERSIR